MSNKHRIETVLDMLKLSPEEFQRMVPDLCAWYAFNREAELFGATCTGLVWVDDGKTGQIHSVVATVKSTGETTVFKGPAHPEAA